MKKENKTDQIKKFKKWKDKEIIKSQKEMSKKPKKNQKMNRNQKEKELKNLEKKEDNIKNN